MSLSIQTTPTGALYPKELLLRLLRLPQTIWLSLRMKFTLHGHDDMHTPRRALIRCLQRRHEWFVKSHRIAIFVGWMVSSFLDSCYGYIIQYVIQYVSVECFNQVVQTSYGQSMTVRWTNLSKEITNAIQEDSRFVQVKPILDSIPKSTATYTVSIDDEQFVLIS